MGAPGKASEKPLTAAEMREEARRCLEAAEKERDVAVRMTLHERALRLAIAAEQLDRHHTRKALVPSTREKPAA
jgi:hypothetical protein